MFHGHSLFTTIHKHYTPEQWVEFAQKNPRLLANVAISQGIGGADQEKVESIIEQIPQINYI